jgi:hypothetical protein
MQYNGGLVIHCLYRGQGFLSRKIIGNKGVNRNENE